MKAIGADLDCFVSVSDIKIHILSGGGKLPTDIASWDIKEYRQRLQKVSEMKDIYNVDINPFLQNIISVTEEYAQNVLEAVLPMPFYPIKGQNSLQEYIRRFYAKPFVRFAQKGFFSFDKTNLENPWDTHYHLVAYPKDEEMHKALSKMFNQEFDKLLLQPMELSNFIKFADLQ